MSVEQKAKQLIDTCRQLQWRIVAAESCTGGLLSSTLIDVAGASEVFERGYVTYSNVSKSDVLDVPIKLIAQHGAVSPQVAVSMAKGALDRAAVNLSVAITGIAGPDGGSEEKPVGLVYIATGWVKEGRPSVLVQECHFKGDRAAIRHAAVDTAIDMMLQCTHND